MTRIVYSTQSLILGAYPYGEAHKVFTLLTRDLGTITALAMSVRSERSKLRYALEPFSLVGTSLVSAKRGWRITTAEPQRSFFFEIEEKNKRELMFRIMALVRRLAIGETHDPALFDLVIEGMDALQNTPTDSIKGLETILVMRILETLGYGIDTKEQDLYEGDIRDTQLHKQALRDRRKLVSSINQALEMSGL